MHVAGGVSLPRSLSLELMYWLFLEPLTLMTNKDNLKSFSIKFTESQTIFS